MSPTKRRQAVEHVRDALGRDRVSERRACKVIGQYRSTQRRVRHISSDEPRLIHEMTQLALQYGVYGYRTVTGLLNQWYGWDVNHKRVARLWRREGLKVPKKQPKRRRLWLNDGSCVRLRPSYKDHVWSYDFMTDRTSDDVLERLTHLFVIRGVPDYIRSDNGPEFTAKTVRQWLEKVGVKTLFITPGSPWENGYIESFNGKLRDQLLNREIFDTILEAKVLIECWRQHYNTVRSHSSLGYRPPAPEAIQPWSLGSGAVPLHLPIMAEQVHGLT